MYKDIGYFGTFSAVVNFKSDEVAQFFKNYYEENIGLKHDNEINPDMLVYARENNWDSYQMASDLFLVQKNFKGNF